ncbi:MAG: shikimate kinase [Leptospiraceae bacterium]|nr:MAG: shikimate kinase [Leptospiraceae bacterium]
MRIALIGPRGAGKSKLSRKISKKTGRLLLSTDQLICYEAGGRTVKEIVEQEGWQSFRNREYELLKKLQNMDNIIIDCGGGILFELDPDTNEEIESKRKISLLQDNTFIIYILRDIEWLLNKDLKNSQRPDLNQNKEYREILQKRMPVYEKYAHYILDMRNKDIIEGVEELLQLPQFNLF